VRKLKLNRKISIIGLGYVGLPVAVAFGMKNPVIGFDINTSRIEELTEGSDSTNEIEKEQLSLSDIHFTSDPEDLNNSDFHIIAVPTPIDMDKQPDLRPILKVSEMLGKNLKVGDIVVYESTVYPGCTEEDCVPILENASGLEFNKDFFVGYSPERIVPGSKERVFNNIKKIVSGSTEETLEIVASVYESVVKPGVHRAPSIAVAEAAKVIENTQRDVNIALVNELALIFDRAGLDTHSILDAAGTKWNFHHYSPGLVGGHCIGVDPYYLVRKAGRLGLHTDLISSARRINNGMGIFIAQKTCRQMIKAGLTMKGAIVTIFGISFKEDCSDLRNSKVPDIILELKSLGIQVQVTDPLADSKECMKEFHIKLIPEDKLKPATAIIVAVAHPKYSDWSVDKWCTQLIPGGVIVDVKGIIPTKEIRSRGYSLWRL